MDKLHDEQASADALSPEQKQALETFYIAAYPSLRQFCFDLWDGLLVWDCDSILERLPVSTYPGVLEAESFTLWAQAHLSAEVMRLRFVTEAVNKHRATIGAALWKAHAGWTEDHSYDTDDLFSEVAALIWSLSDRLSKPGSAKLRTRLYALGRRHGLNGTKKRNRRHGLALARAGEIAGCEIAPPSDEVRATA